jgi:hypothetical protein
MADLETILKKILSFRSECDWAQFHDPKNLAEALSIAAVELPTRNHKTYFTSTPFIYGATLWI